MTGLTYLAIHEAEARLSSRGITARALTEAYLARIEAVDPGLNAYIRVMVDAALAQANESDRRATRLSPLDGIPVALKDNIDLAGVPTTNGLAPRDGMTPQTDATVVRQLREAGAVILGKLNLDEGALGATTNNEHHGRTQNPWCSGVTPGGSSGGPAAAVAGRLCAAALGTDTMGSIRIPAAYCGVAGLKPTFGVVSTRGVVPLSWRLDHVGPLCRSVRDLGLVLDSIAGYDPAHPESVAVPDPGGYGAIKAVDVSGATVGIITNFDRVALPADLRQAFESALRLLRLLGANFREITLSDYDPSKARLAGLLVVEAEGAVSLEAELIAHPNAVSATLRAMLDYGRNVERDRLIKAKRMVRRAGLELNRAFDKVDVVAAPTTPQTAFPFDAPVPVNQADLTALANFAGCPALSLPCGLSDDRKPIGLQLIGPAFSERKLLSVALAFESACDYVLPPLPAESTP